MQTITMVLTLLVAVTACSFLARLLPWKLPLPLIQIAVGAGVSYATGFEVALDPDIFFLMFIPPLLFLDGWRIPKGAFFRDIRPILLLAIGLVVFTVVGAGFLIDRLIPAIPLAVAFALAAILSPTDPMAVSAIAARTPIPRRLMHILEGEALLNDASGLVCFRFAVAAALTGQFSPAKASLEFLAVAGGGIAIGAVAAWGISLANSWLIDRAGEEPGVQVLISLLVPFAAYLAAEHMHVSGILAAATAGIAMHYADLRGHVGALGITRMQRTVVWDTVHMVLNGTVFVLLGQQLPRILESVSQIVVEAGIGSLWTLVGYIICITLMLTVMRLLWVWASLRLTLYRRGQRVPRNFFHLLMLTAFAGVRGAITLAGILTLPLTMPDGAAFPARDLAIFLAMGVILLSLIMASIALPLLTASIEFAPASSLTHTEIHARNATAEAAIARLEQLSKTPAAAREQQQASREAERRILDLYRRRLHDGYSTEDAQQARQLAEAERQLRIEALRAEREKLLQLRLAQQIEDPLHQKMVHEIDLMEAALMRRDEA